MTTRYNAKPSTSFGVSPLPTGFTGKSVPEAGTVTVPAVGIEDVDVALFKMFDTEMHLQVKGDSIDGMKKVPVVFASGEKWAILKKGRALRDKNNSLILPILTIGRTSIQQTPNEDIAGRGINQQTGEIVIKNRLNSGDRSYQSLINRLMLRDQANLAVNRGQATVDEQVLTSRKIGDLQSDPVVQDGGLLLDNKLNNVIETIVIPAPQFFTAVYEIIVWTQYTTHMNQVLEGIVSSQLPQGNAWKLVTDKGYWFIATVEGNLYSPENNFDDMSSEERIIKHKFTIKVPGYILASDTPGAPVPVRRYVSSPSIEFSVAAETITLGTEEPFLGSDDPTLPMSVEKTRNRGQREDGKTRLYPSLENISPNDPALKTIQRGQPLSRFKKVVAVDKDGNVVTKLLRIKNINKHTGEAVYAPDASLGGLTVIATED